MLTGCMRGSRAFVMLVLVSLCGCLQFFDDRTPDDGGPVVDGDLVEASTLQVVDAWPAPESGGVESTTAIRVTLSRPVSMESLVNVATNTSTGALVLKDDIGGDVPGTITYNPASYTVTLSPTAALAPDRRYTAILRDVRDDDGAALAEEYRWSFVTLSATQELRLSVSSTVPGSGSTDFPRNGAILVTFDKELDATSLVNPTTNTGTGTFILKTPTGANVAGTVTYNPSTSTVAFVPTSYLSANLTYIASIKDVRTLDGQALAEPYVWTFTTGTTPGAPPTVLSASPTQDETAVSRAASIHAVFSEPVTGIAAGTFVVRDLATNTVLTARSLVFDNVTLTATFRPQTHFSPNTMYSVTIQDVAGLTGFLMPQHTWSFTTGDSPDTTPVVLSMNPAAGASGVPRNARVLATFNGAVTGVSTTGFLLRNAQTNALVTAESATYLPATRTAQFVPNTYLLPNTRYTATLRGILSVDGVPMPEMSWDFTTGAGPDIVVPTVTAAGLAARANCADEATLSWSAGSDDVTPQSGLAYQVFISRSTGGYDLNAPTLVTGPGAASQRLTGLLPGTTYFFTVRAVDAAGNRSTAFTERSITTPTQLRCAASIALGGTPQSVTSADFNGDGAADLAIARGAAASVAILLGDGNGGFAAATPATGTVGNDPVDVEAADMTGDGNIDLIVACRGGGQVSVLRGNGNGTFLAAVNTAVPGAQSLAIGEFNNPANANRDVAVATGDDVTVLSGNGDGTFSATTARLTLAATSDVRAVAAADFDGDGLTDVAAAYAGTDQVGAWLNSTPAAGALAFTAPTTATNRLFAVQNAPLALTALDIEHDGRPDLAAVNAATPSVTVRSSSSLAANLFPGGENTALTAGSLPTSVASGDFDGDGLPDLVCANRAGGTISVLLNVAGSSVFTVETADAGGQPSGVCTADFNGDGATDAAVSNAGDGTVTILLNIR